MVNVNYYPNIISRILSMQGNEYAEGKYLTFSDRSFLSNCNDF